MSQVLDDGRTIAFGQSLEEIEEMSGYKAVDSDKYPPKLARGRSDKILKSETLSLEFDSGRLKRIRFESGYEFRNPLTPYPEPWKNLPAIGLTRISCRMHRNEFLAYLKAWEDRAKALGAEPVEAGEDLSAQQYAVGIVPPTFADVVSVQMGPSRRAGGGGLWSDGWTAFFTMESERRDKDHPVGSLQSLSAFRDEFNTWARRITGPRL